MVSRHDLVWLSGAGWQAAIAASGESALERWHANGWPAVGTRRAPDLGADAVNLGIALPPDAEGVKRRIWITAATAHVTRSAPALALAAVLDHAPADWRVALAQLAAQVNLRVYGSLALQALTGQAYLRAGSDIDLLFAPASAAELSAGLAHLRAAPLPLDGEIRFPGGACVAWREWTAAYAAGARVLTKSDHGVRLERADLLAASLP